MSSRKFSIFFIFLIIFQNTIEIDYQAESIRVHLRHKGKLEVISKVKIEDKDVGTKELVRGDNNYPFYYGGKYVDENGNNVILLTDNNEIARKEICDKLGITESNTVFKKAKYSYNYLTELQYMISNAMAEKELPFVISSALKEDTNNIEVIVNTNNENDIKNLNMYDRKGGAIKIKYSNDNAVFE